MFPDFDPPYFIFNKGTRPRPAPYAVIKKDNKIIYSPNRYGDGMLLNVVRYKGSTGNVNLTWGVIIGPNTRASFNVSPVAGQLEFIEGQWNSSIHLMFHSILDTDKELEISVKLLNVSGGGMLGNVTTVKITSNSSVEDNEVTRPKEDDDEKSRFILIVVLPCVIGGLLIIGVIATAIYRRRSKKR